MHYPSSNPVNIPRLLLRVAFRLNDEEGVGTGAQKLAVVAVAADA
jgi:hypothetical protein